LNVAPLEANATGAQQEPDIMFSFNTSNAEQATLQTMLSIKLAWSN